MTDWAKYPNFTEDEFRCQCGCGGAPMDDKFMTILQAIRDGVGPLRVSSGYRCPDHNNRVSNTGMAGPHTTGKAVDIAVIGGDALMVVKEALSLGIERIGVNQKGSARFIHLDISDRHPSPTMWSY